MSGAAEWAEYLRLLRELHHVRAAAAERGENTEETVRARAARLDEFTEQVRAQENRVVQLTDDLRKPVRFHDLASVAPAPPKPWDQGIADLKAQLSAADKAVTDVEYFARRPSLLPDAPGFLRNALIYLVYSLPNLCLNVGLWVFYLSANDTVGNDFTAAAWGCCFWPVLAVIAGMVTIRMVGVPRLKPKPPENSFDPIKEPVVQVNIMLGLFIAFGTSAFSILVLWLAGAAIGA